MTPIEGADDERQKYEDERSAHDEELKKGSPNMSDGKRDTLCTLLQAYGLGGGDSSSNSIIPNGDILTMISESPPKFSISAGCLLHFQILEIRIRQLKRRI